MNIEAVKKGILAHYGVKGTFVENLEDLAHVALMDSVLPAFHPETGEYVQDAEPDVNNENMVSMCEVVMGFIL